VSNLRTGLNKEHQLKKETS